MSAVGALGARRCEGCALELSPAFLSCPACHRLVHGAALAALARDAQDAEDRRDLSAALRGWRAALDLLPAHAGQHTVISERVRTLSAQLDASGQPAPAPAAGAAGGSRWRWLGGLGAVGVLAAKLKWPILLIASKAKFLLAGLGQASTVFSMLLSFGVYWAAWGWPFALGFIAAMYVHEMGHVAALVRYGIPAAAPMFVPGFGAFVRLNQHPATLREDARVGLAGPVWGTAAALVAWLASLALGSPLLAAIARTAAWLNLFNLLPLWQLDGGRGFRALSRGQRGAVSAAFVAGWVWSHESLLALIALAAVGRTVLDAPPAEGDSEILAEFLGLVAVLTALASLSVSVPGVP